MIEIVRADLNNHVHAKSLIHLMREYALDPMGGGKDLSAFAIDNLASFLNNRNDAHVIFAFHDNEAIGLVTCMEGNTPVRSAYAKFGFQGYELDPKIGKAQFWEKLL